MKALFCTDGSEISFYTLNNLSNFTKNIEVDILCVVDWHFYPMYMNYPYKDYQNTYDEISDKILEYAESEINKKGLIVGDKQKSYGVASEEILKLTQKIKYDLIILGSHGKKGVQSWLGSVSRNIVTHVKEPILISKQSDNNKKIVFAVDGSDCANHALEKGLQLLDLTDKEIYTLFVMEDVSTLPLEITSNQEWFEDILQKQQRFSEDLFVQVEQKINSFGYDVKDKILLVGNPAKEIIKVCSEKYIDLIVMGSHSMNKFTNILLGSTSKRVLENVKNSVLLVSSPLP